MLRMFSAKRKITESKSQDDYIVIQKNAKITLKGNKLTKNNKGMYKITFDKWQSNFDNKTGNYLG